MDSASVTFCKLQVSNKVVGVQEAASLIQNAQLDFDTMQMLKKIGPTFSASGGTTLEQPLVFQVRLPAWKVRLASLALEEYLHRRGEPVDITSVE